MRNDSVFGRRIVCVGVQSEAIGMLSVRIRQRMICSRRRMIHVRREGGFN